MSLQGGYMAPVTMGPQQSLPPPQQPAKQDIQPATPAPANPPPEAHHSSSGLGKFGKRMGMPLLSLSIFMAAWGRRAGRQHLSDDTLYGRFPHLLEMIRTLHVRIETLSLGPIYQQHASKLAASSPIFPWGLAPRMPLLAMPSMQAD